MDVLVNVGDCAVSSNPSDIIKTYALATCVGITAFSRRNRVAGMLHSLLPNCPDAASKVLRPYTYVDTGLPIFIEKMLKSGCLKSDIVFQVYGGASSSAKQDFFKIGSRNLVQAEDILIAYRVDYRMIDVAGHFSRTLIMEALTGNVKVNRLDF